MADKSITQTIKDAEIDARSLSEFISKDASFDVYRRLAPNVHTLDYYITMFDGVSGRLLDESRRFKASADLAAVDISKAVNSANSKVAQIEQTVQNAIDNTAVDGGILADTFVTVTSNNGTVARSLRSKNSDMLSIEDFRAEGDDDTAAFTKAVRSGRAIYLPDGDYTIKQDSISCGGKDFILYANNASITIVNGKRYNVFDVSDSRIVDIKGVRFKSIGDSTKVVLGISKTSYTESFVVSDCEFSGNLSLIRATGSFTQDPNESIYGFKHWAFKNNVVRDCTVSFVTISNYPMYNCEIKNNRITNFSFNCFYFGIENGSSNASLINSINNFVVSDNTVENDDNCWLDIKSGSYFCFLLAEGKKIDYIRNKVSGMKTNLPYALYDAYLAARDLLCEDNLYLNNACFDKDSVETNILIKSKSPTALKGTRKVIRGNTYRIEKSWLTRIGKESASHTILDSAHSGDLLIDNNVFMLDDMLEGRWTACDRVVIKNNYIESRTTKGDSAFRLLAEDENSSLEFSNNTVIFNASSKLYAIRGSGNTTPYWDSFSMVGNKFGINPADVAGSFVLYNVRSKSTKILNNTFNATFSADFADCDLGELMYTGNTFDSLGTISSFSNNGISISGQTVVNNNYNLRASIFYFATHMFSPTFDSHKSYKINVKIDLSSSKGFNTFSFSYSVLWDDVSAYNVKWTNAAGTEVTSTMKSASSTEQAKLLKEGSGTNNPTLNFYNRASDITRFGISNLPTEKAFYTIAVNFSEISPS